MFFLVLLGHIPLCGREGFNDKGTLEIPPAKTKKKLLDRHSACHPCLLHELETFLDDHVPTQSKTQLHTTIYKLSGLTLSFRPTPLESKISMLCALLGMKNVLEDCPR